MKKVFKGFLISLYILLLATFIVPFKKYVIYLPGGLMAIDQEIEIVGKESNEEFYSIYVLSKDKPTLFQLFTAKLSKSADINKLPAYDKESFARGMIQEEIGYQKSLIVAYSEASKVDPSISINYERVGYAVLRSTNSKINLGDVITKIDDIYTNTLTDEEFTDYLKNNNEVDVEVLRNKELINLTINKNEEGKYGLSFDNFYKIIDTNPVYIPYYQDDRKVGPSGGLLQTLSIYSTLLNINYELVITGTGTMEANGLVGPIGGIKQKVISANKKADIFLCPEMHYDEALKAYQSIKNPTFELIKVETFDEAITQLSNYL